MSINGGVAGSIAPQNFKKEKREAAVGTHAKSLDQRRVGVLGVFKKVFSKRPEDVIGATILSKGNVAITLVALYALLTSLAVMTITNGIFREAFSGLSDIVDVAPVVSPDNVGIFMNGLLLAVVLFFVLLICTMSLFIVLKVRVSIVRVIKLVAAALTITTVAMTAAIVCSFVFAQVALLLVGIGVLGSTIILYVGIAKIAGKEKNIFWPFLAMCAIAIVVYNSLT